MKKRSLRYALLGVTITLALGVTPVTSLAAWYPDDVFVAVNESYGKSKLNAEPVCVLDVTDKETAESLTAGGVPTAILNLDEDMNVVGEKGEVIRPLAEAMDEYLKKSVIPILNLKTTEQAEKLISWFKTEREISDVSVMSKSADAVKKFKTAYPYARGIIEFGEDADVTETYKIANRSGANVCVIPEKIATVENVRYIQGRFKTVWVRAESETESSVKNSVFSGAYGVIVKNAGAFGEVIGSLEGLTRLPFNVAHRGLPNEYNENSVSGTVAAVNEGATHVELDCYLTTDGEIAFMHDAGLQRTSTGRGNIESYTSAELKNFRLKQFEDEAIPFFEDIAGALKGTDTVLVLEIKSEKTEIVSALKEKLEGSGIEEQTVVISFHESQLEKMKEILPEIPTADLNGVTSDTLKTIVKRSGKNNSGVDYNYNALDEDKIKGLVVRGFIPWTWTYTNEFDAVYALEDGVMGITNNNANVFKTLPLYLNGKNTTDKIPEKGGDIKLVVTEYGGAKKEVVGKITDATKLNGDSYEVFAEYNPEEDYYIGAKLHTQKFTVTVKTPEPESENSAGGESNSESKSESNGGTSGAGSGGCGAKSGSGTGAAVLAAALFCGALKIIKGKENG